jgi:integrase
VTRGSIRERRGRQFARITIAGVEHSGAFDSREDAERFIARTLAIAEAEAIGKAEPTLASIADDFFDAREAGGYVGHGKRERSVWRVHIESDEALSTRPLRSIRITHLVEWSKRLAARPSSRGGTISKQTQKNAIVLVRAALLYAHRRGFTSANVGEGLVPIKSRTGASPWGWLANAEILTVLARPAIETDVTRERRAIYATAIYAGLRASEMLHLRWENVHLGGRRPRIEVRAPIKTPAALRDVPLLPPIIEHLGEWHVHQGEPKTGLVWPGDKAEFGNESRHHENFDAAWADHPYIVQVERDGKTIPERKVRPGALARAGIKRHIRFHDLRHTFCSHLAQGTWGHAFTLHEIKDLAGHSDIKTTMRYAHLSPLGIHGIVAGLRAGWTDRATDRASENVGSPKRNPPQNEADSVADAIGVEPMTFGFGTRNADE